MATSKNNPSSPSSDDNTGDTTPSTPEQLAEQAKNKIAEVSHEASAAMSRMTGQVEDLARRTLDRARETSAQVKERIGRAGDATVTYIKDEPVKAVMIAAATGAATALLISWLSSRRREH